VQGYGLNGTRDAFFSYEEGEVMEEGEGMLTPQVTETMRLSAHRRQVRLVRESLINRPERREGSIAHNRSY
jgi:hypothetical protein